MMNKIMLVWLLMRRRLLLIRIVDAEVVVQDKSCTRTTIMRSRFCIYGEEHLMPVVMLSIMTKDKKN